MDRLCTFRPNNFKRQGDIFSTVPLEKMSIPEKFLVAVNLIK